MPFKDWERPGEQPRGQQQNQQPQGNLKQPAQQRQQGGMKREPNLEKNQQQNPPKHDVD